MPLTFDNEWTRRLECKACRVTFTIQVDPFDGSNGPETDQITRAFIETMTYCPHCGKPELEDVE